MHTGTLCICIYVAIHKLISTCKIFITNHIYDKFICWYWRIRIPQFYDNNYIEYFFLIVLDLFNSSLYCIYFIFCWFLRYNLT